MLSPAMGARHIPIPDDPWAICVGTGRRQGKGSKCSPLLAARLDRLRSLCHRLDTGLLALPPSMDFLAMDRRYTRGFLWTCLMAAAEGFGDCQAGRVRSATRHFDEACQTVNWIPSDQRGRLLGTLRVTAQRRVP